jgi:hypothetical protein
MFRRIFIAIKSFFLAISRRICHELSWITYHISRITTGAVAIGGALCGINTVGGEIQTSRLATAGFAFVIGLPLGLLLFGPMFNLTTWLGIVIGILFVMNIHNAWEVLISLKYGGLDYIIAKEAVASVDNITPSEKDIKNLVRKLEQVQSNLNRNALNVIPYKNLLKEPKNA